MAILPWDYKHDGSDGLTINGCATTSLTTAGTGISITATTGILYAQPFFVGAKGISSMRIGFWCSATGTGNLRFGIYSALSPSAQNTYPQDLIMDFGEIAASSTGARYSSLETVNLTNGLYWVTVMTDGGTGTAIRRTDVASETTILGARDFPGVNATSGINYDINVTQTYGAMPATYPVGGVYGSVARVGSVIALKRSY